MIGTRQPLSTIMQPCSAVSILGVSQNLGYHLGHFYSTDCSTIVYRGLHYWVPPTLGNYHFEVSKALETIASGFWALGFTVDLRHAQVVASSSQRTQDSNHHASELDHIFYCP